jgi:Glyoxalase/Bleomycin resistance protein/Dioxygenase superfamily
MPLRDRRCGMKVKGIAWLGVQTSQVPEMRRFLSEALGLDVAFEERDFVVFTCASVDKVEIFGPGGPQPPEQFECGDVVAGFLVDDIEQACEDLRAAAGVELIGELQRTEGGDAWQHFRAPDGKVFELTYDPNR